MRIWLALLALWGASCAGLRPAAAPPAGYVFSYFTGNGESGLHLAYSRDGLRWQPLNGGRPVLAPRIGAAPGDMLMRDPAITQGPDGRFHLVWTTSWKTPAVGYASSDDLIHWSAQQAIPVMEDAPTTRNVWAPELFWEAAEKRWLLFWSSTVPGRFPETAGSSETAFNHRIYYTTTRDFKTFAPSAVFYDPGFNAIDATLMQDGGRFVMFLKNETLAPAPEKNLRMATAARASGPYGPASAALTGDYWAEGPTAVRIGQTWHLYFDKYRDHAYGVMTSDDLRTWTDRSADLRFVEGARHGTVFPVTAGVLERLRALRP